MVSADQQMIRGKQYALELTGATNEDGNALTAGSQIVVKHVAGDLPEMSIIVRTMHNIVGIIRWKIIALTKAAAL